MRTKAYRFWRHFNRQSLTIKLIVAFSLIVFVLVLLGATVMMSISKKAIAETSVTTALYRTQLLKTKLIETMIQENAPHEKLQDTLEDVRFGESVGEINIFNPEGEIRFSNIKKNIAKKSRFRPKPERTTSSLLMKASFSLARFMKRDG